MTVLTQYCINTTFETIIMVSHGALINSILASLSNHIIGTGKTKLKNACINVVTYINQSLNIEMYNLSSDEFIKEM